MTAHYIPKEELTTPKTGLQAIVNYWWWEKDGMILDWRIGGHCYMQANSSFAVMEQLKDHKLYAGHTPVQIPVAYYPRDL